MRTDATSFARSAPESGPSESHDPPLAVIGDGRDAEGEDVARSRVRGFCDEVYRRSELIGVFGLVVEETAGVGAEQRFVEAVALWVDGPKGDMADLLPAHVDKACASTLDRAQRQQRLWTTLQTKGDVGELVKLKMSRRRSQW